MRIASFLLAAAITQAATISVTSGSGATISDNATQTIDIIIVDTRPIIGSFFVSLNSLTHTWIGDLSATVTHVDTATTVQLFQRPGRTTTGAGCNDNFNGTYTFSDSGAAALGCLPGNTDIPAGTYRASLDVGLTDEQVHAIANAFNTQLANGTWRLSIIDSAGGNTGAIGSWTVNFNVQDTPGVPEPGTWALLAAGLCVIAFQRRKQN
jgi:subtilisin-like proprotein convertase family protein